MRRLIILWAYFLGSFVWAQSTTNFLPDAGISSDFTSRAPAMNLIKDNPSQDLQKQETKGPIDDSSIIDEEEAERVEELYEEAPEF
ncbi:MAG TPA: hypothetical protein VNJ01_07660 [Bacteriovoracaceae bacterium]|nr:hypothetical protein [Bacteriovoracaceae bacterium]